MHPARVLPEQRAVNGNDVRGRHVVGHRAGLPSARRRGASARTCGASARTCGATARTCGATARTCGATVRTCGASARTCGAGTRTLGASRRCAHARFGNGPAWCAVLRCERPSHRCMAAVHSNRVRVPTRQPSVHQMQDRVPSCPVGGALLQCECAVMSPARTR